jgi:hypothetical protein
MLVVGTAAELRADVCVRATNKVVKGKVVTSLSKATRSGKCKNGEVSALTGPQGADGQRRIYGDGSGGAKIIATDETLADPIAMFTDVVINNGATLTVPSGTVIRCTGSFTNNGTILVLPGTRRGRMAVGITTDSLITSYAYAEAGVSVRGAAYGEGGNSANNRSGGLGGKGLSVFEAALLRYPGTRAGGAGAGGLAFEGGGGGGSLVVLCKGGILNGGDIQANGESDGGGGGGGGGGIIILASATSVTSPAESSIFAQGGDGAASTASTGPGGGGGGGIIHLIAPAVDTTGAAVSVFRGAGGVVSSTPMSNTLRIGGPGGGASGG